MNLLGVRVGEFANGAGLPMHLHLGEDEARVENGEAEGGDGDHDAVQGDEVGLVLHDRIAPAVGHLADTEDATGEDGQVCEEEAAGEELEAGRTHEFDGRGLELRSVAVHAEGVVRDHGAEDEEGEDLPYDTGHHEVVTDILQRGARVGGGCDASTGSL